jgi:organic radical activating enzyme
MRPALLPKSARITEIFSSLQGEGPRIGERHIFIRFEACHMACAYCDEIGKKGRLMSMADILGAVEALEKKHGPHACVSLTGGEPLLYTDILKPLCRALKKRKLCVLLETSGVLWRDLSKVVGDCDIIAMDLKLASVTKQCDFLEDHRKFLQIAKKKDVYVKVVISKRADACELDRHLRMVASVAPETPVFLQPMDRPGKSYPDRSLMRHLNELQRIGARRLSDVRVGIQLHKILNIH